MKSFQDFINEKKDLWSGNIESGWHPPEGLFQTSATNIAKVLLAADKSKAMKRLTFYINRAGENLSSEDEQRLNHAKEIISKTTSSKE